MREHAPADEVTERNSTESASRGNKHQGIQPAIITDDLRTTTTTCALLINIKVKPLNKERLIGLTYLACAENSKAKA